MINALNFLSFFRYLQHQETEKGNKPKEERRHHMDGCHYYLKSSGDDLLLQTSFSDLGDHIF